MICFDTVELGLFDCSAERAKLAIDHFSLRNAGGLKVAKSILSRLLTDLDRMQKGAPMNHLLGSIDARSL
ncbi:hypothetical protein DS906_11680 [Ruegeria sp. A3M17]|nr:hypothetical protein DS906_11680 [Ruegeria sp. A3M17]